MYRLVAKSLAATVVMGALIAGPASAATWTIVPSQAVGSGSVLFGVDALSATMRGRSGGSGNGLVERWDGTRWAAVASPDLLDHSNPNSWATLNAVDAVSADQRVRGRRRQRRRGGAVQRHELEHDLGPEPRRRRAQRRQGVLCPPTRGRSAAARRPSTA